MQDTVIVMEGVLRSAASEGCIKEGAALYRALAGGSRLHILTAQWDIASASRWLAAFNMTGHMRIVVAVTESPADRVDALSKIPTYGLPPLVIEADPECAAEEVRHGYPVLLFARPYYSDLGWQPDVPKVARPWADVMAEMERQEELYYADSRLRGET